ncbi:MAG: hypothetical protein A3A80_00390 [Candidatus Terrybacteria bacterium RIFCSPLOWO2_01_FULL_44_24]|uniref:Uncharacterized protein n=1 Tax=Candidatus Terrybacteria bacterium RIFCSPHIGHO2_01_FULL_43_35 TaxID=1802361 RepID=A0A1G2PCE4_9BACT|nr:MAG: hypothetical protein A2828_00880 [Candidatus Terrybacteria bacterium RIFCSPHIGHO2_01_FULL_43_35]OHA51960.1 MAG: hypothetical protein A3A80_00390 [Candidatus Terrybacteria bacterium RIFCSPLOWO2_01_FULL_44_24]
MPENALDHPGGEAELWASGVPLEAELLALEFDRLGRAVGLDPRERVDVFAAIPIVAAQHELLAEIGVVLDRLHLVLRDEFALGDGQEIVESPAVGADIRYSVEGEDGLTVFLMVGREDGDSVAERGDADVLAADGLQILVDGLDPILAQIDLQVQLGDLLPVRDALELLDLALELLALQGQLACAVDGLAVRLMLLPAQCAGNESVDVLDFGLSRSGGSLFRHDSVYPFVRCFVHKDVPPCVRVVLLSRC